MQAETNSDYSQLLGVRDAAAWLGVSRRTLWKLIGMGAMPVVRVGRRTIRVDRADLRQFVEERRERRGGVQ